MNNQDKQIVKNMIEFVEEKERQIQAAKMIKNSKTKAVSDIIKELERQIKKCESQV